MTGWEAPTEGFCEYSAGYKYVLRRAMRVWTRLRPKEPIETDFVRLDVDGSLTLRAGYAWNGASGPTLDTVSTIRGSAAHDAIYQLLSLGLLEPHDEMRALGDQELAHICAKDGMWMARAGVWEWAVRTFGGRNARKLQPVLRAP